MYTDPQAERFANRPLAHVLTAHFMPESEVSQRTYTTYQIGAQLLLQHLMSGDYDKFASPREGHFIAEFARRIIANAERQDILPQES